MNLFKYLRMLIVALLTFSSFSSYAMENASSEDCGLCCQKPDKKLLECPKCHQKFCRTCAERWIGVTFSYTTNFLGSEQHNQAKNSSCPYCKQPLTRDDLDSMILASDPQATLRTETQLLIEKIERKESLPLQRGTIRSCNVPVILVDGVKFAVITDQITSDGNISLDFSNFNLIILSDITANNDILIKSKNAYFLGDVNGDNISLDMREMLVCFGVNIYARTDLVVPPESRRLLGGTYRTERLAFITEFKNALAEENEEALSKLGTLIKHLLLFNGNPS